MTIETKFNIGDSIWYMDNNKACNRSVSSIIIRITEYGVSVGYYVSKPRKSITLDEKLVFSSKEELIKSL